MDQLADIKTKDLSARHRTGVLGYWQMGHRESDYQAKNTMQRPEPESGFQLVRQDLGVRSLSTTLCRHVVSRSTTPEPAL